MKKSLVERDKKAVWHPFTAQKYMSDPLPIVKGEGSCLIDADGKRYIDAISSWWVNLHGHGHSYIAEKIYEQAKTLEQVIFAGFTHEPAVRLAERLLEILPPGFARIFYSDNGSTSTEVAIKMAIQYWWNKGDTKRNKILAFNNSYHGDTFGAMSVSDRSVFTLAFHNKLFEVVFIDPPNNNVKSYPAVGGTNLKLEEVACFIYEPLVQGAGGMRMYEAPALSSLLKDLHAHDIICIADEVMTGFGRTGKLFASEYMEEKPDIICLSKGLTGGTMPLGVTACSEKIYDAFVDEDKMKTFFHGHSFTANPLGCTAALASLDLLQMEDCKLQIEMISKKNKELAKRLQELNLKYNHFTKEKSPQFEIYNLQSKIKNIRLLGTILAFEVTHGKDEYLNNISTVITEMALSKGVYLRPLGNTVYIMPPYCITAVELDRVYNVIEEILVEINAS